MNELQPPVAPAGPATTTVHGVERIDEYAWLRNRDDPAVAEYLEAENAYTDARMAHTQSLQDALFEEIRSRIDETDESVPARRGDWWYLTRTYEGRQYPVVCRRRGAPDGPEEVLLDVNALAEGHDYFNLGVMDVSPDGRLLAYAFDTTGSEQYTMRIRELDAGTDLPDIVESVYYGSAWAIDASAVFYTRQDDAMRPYQVWRHVLGTDPATDVCLIQEDDEELALHLDDDKSRQWVVATAANSVTSEVRVLRSADPDGEFRVVRDRRDGVLYYVEPAGDRFLILTNDAGAVNFKVMEAPIDQPSQWTPLVEHRPDVRVDGIEVFATHMILSERSGGGVHLSVRTPDGRQVRRVHLPEEIGIPEVGPNYELDSPSLRFHYQSLVTPPTVFDEELETAQRTHRKTMAVHGYDAAQFQAHRLWATAPDNTLVPISLVAPAGAPLDGTNPTLLYGYGSYESSTDPFFSPVRLSLLQRGFVFAIAHVRGGGEMGRAWYEDGKYLAKRNTFTDFIACAEHLVGEGWTSPERLAIRGGSAGGLLMGAVVNLRPDLFRAVIADVPFVDVVNTMLDETLPLTAGEWEEWGNPRDPEYFEYMLSYSPYDNVSAQNYPAMLVTAGLNDPRVAYWEPAKWVARLRSKKTDSNVLLLQTEMGAGHGGPSGRYNAWRKEAFRMAFVLDVLGVA